MPEPTGEGEDVVGPGSSAFFSSARERRLWACALLVLLAILATVGLAQTLAGFLQDHGFLTGFFALGLLLVIATVATQGLKVRPRGAEIAVALGIAAVYLMMLARMALPTERSHLIEYSVLAVFIHEALIERASHGRRVPLPALLAFLATVAIGSLDEAIQAVVPGRVFDPMDLVFNALAATLAIGGGVLLGWVRRITLRRARGGGSK